MSDNTMREWAMVCATFCKRVNAELLFVNSDSFGAMFPDGSLRHIYADELAAMLDGGDDHALS